jgi:LysM repeat protein
LILPGSSSSGNSVSSSIVTSVVSSGTTNYTTYTTYAPPVVTYSSGKYIVQYGDTFSGIASRNGLSINQLWTANPQVWNINYLYAGQSINIPTTSGGSSVANSAGTTSSFGTVPKGTSYGVVRLVNKSGGDVSVSLQGTTRDGVSVIYEYTVSGTMKAKVPDGWYTYVAWVNGRQSAGTFNLSQDADHSIIFSNDGTVVE